MSQLLKTVFRVAYDVSDVAIADGVEQSENGSDLGCSYMFSIVPAARLHDLQSQSQSLLARGERVPGWASLEDDWFSAPIYSISIL